MTDELNRAMEGWTIPLREHIEALAAKDALLQTERDRRYAEVSVEREKALKIKEVADLAALQLAREIQSYKDEKANELREQISSERGIYVTRAELKPLADYIQSQIGRDQGISVTIAAIVTVATLLLGLSGVVIALILHG
jgi:hypothetical protein